ncbi:MAG: DNA-protecting protein DprA [Spirochaetia bacterium]|nr:DNA-protecting protein DprA [Spirochaetia bacterium]
MNHQLLALSLSDSLSPKLLLALRELAGSWEKIWEIPEKNLSAFTRRFRTKDFEGKDALRFKADRIIGECQKLGVEILTSDEAHYPHRLSELYLPPLALYLKGALSPLTLSEEKKNIAIVGTRHPDPYYLDFTRSASARLSSDGWHIVSGLALGIDGEAHAAVTRPGQTTAVLAFGHDKVYPAGNKKLFEKIPAEGGALLSEYPPGTPPLRHHFPMRNRIISGLADMVLMVQAGETSGALITVRYALDQNRDILVLEGESANEKAAGNRQLISEGASVVRKVEDILHYYEENNSETLREKESTPDNASKSHPDSLEGRLFRALAGPPKPLTEIARDLSLPAERLVESLMPLLLSGRVAEMPGDRYYLAPSG